MHIEDLQESIEHKQRSETEYTPKSAKSTPLIAGALNNFGKEPHKILIKQKHPKPHTRASNFKPLEKSIDKPKTPKKFTPMKKAQTASVDPISRNMMMRTYNSTDESKAPVVKPLRSRVTSTASDRSGNQSHKSLRTTFKKRTSSRQPTNVSPRKGMSLNLDMLQPVLSRSQVGLRLAKPPLSTKSQLGLKITSMDSLQGINHPDTSHD